MPYVRFNKSICPAIHSGDMHQRLYDVGAELPLYVNAEIGKPYMSFLYGSQALCDQAAGALSRWLWKGEKDV